MQYIAAWLLFYINLNISISFTIFLFTKWHYMLTCHVKEAVYMKRLSFINYKIYVREAFVLRPLTLGDFKLNSNSINRNITVDSITYDITFDILDENKFLWIYSRFGNPTPCPKDVYDKEANIYKNNSRTSKQVELRNQVFALYSFENEVLYCSNSKKRAFLEDFIKNTFNIDVEIKSVFIDIDKFKEKIKRLNSVKFSSCDSLFTQDVSLHKSFKDLLGYEGNLDFTIQINCQTDAGNMIKTILNNIKIANTQQQIKELTLVGTNEKNFEEIFNEGTFSRKFENYFSENEEGLISPEHVQLYLINRINDV